MTSGFSDMAIILHPKTWKMKMEDWHEEKVFSYGLVQHINYFPHFNHQPMKTLDHHLKHAHRQSTATKMVGKMGENQEKNASIYSPLIGWDKSH
jgi:hypothetical protein